MMKKIIPKQIIIEVTSKCNLACKGCPNISDRINIDKHMEPDYYKSIIDRVVKEKINTTIIPWGNGEPLLYPDYDELIKYTSKAKLSQYLTTNGMIWNNKLFEHITDKSTCYQILFSLDGLWTTDTIEKARPRSDRRIIKKNIRKFLNLKLAKKSSIDVGIKLCKRGQDYEEIEEFISYWLDVDGINYVAVGDMLLDHVGGIRSRPCQYPDNNFLVIKPDQRTCFCAYNYSMANNSTNTSGYLDYDTPLLKFYNNKKYTEFRINQQKGIYHPVCSTCGFAYTGMGFQGEVHFRNKELTQKTIFYHRDYYNQFFSYTKKWKKAKYYERGVLNETLFKK